MIRDFSKEALVAPESRDTELTLGTGTLLALGGGLLLLCAVCFGLGYMMGHRNSPQHDAAVTPSQPSSKFAVTPAGSGSKPGARGQAPVQSRSGTDNSDQGGSKPPVSVAEIGASPSQAQVRPALEGQVRPALGAQFGSAQPAAAFPVQPATAQVQGWMVQIAAVTHPEDAQVLVDALRKRGYSVTARREVSDNLIHVQTGPFVNRNDANAVRQKLLNDGYNAVVQ